ncbi:zinc finger protein [Amycolatopsis rhabdoformis]|uniref:Zinc finger protein n=1 Tax=Amycolatopsis rhabdoformis TaxID=1448059 RepID=A0ABZ1IMQ2_9PSEU|nr:zinc finger protein [Amycolatopsis rhabdoformis]WSE34967.1 zinc finger protein [Amycolatopsis rhabdoformis]
MLRWQQAEGKRHALEGPFAPRPEESFVALCGVEVTVAAGDVPQLGGNWFDPTCGVCSSKWLSRT